MFKNYVNQIILNEAARLNYQVSDNAPQTETDLFNSTSLVVWSGQSDLTYFQDTKVNFAMRAIHDAGHLKTRLNFTHAAEIELGKIQANEYFLKYGELIADFIFCEVALQAKYHLETGLFVVDQGKFTKENLKNNRYI